jgi:hypothetical protein
MCQPDHDSRFQKGVQHFSALFYVNPLIRGDRQKIGLKLATKICMN